MAYSIAVDGPAASGKSTAAEMVAKRLGFSRLDSGLLYRAITYLVDKEFPGAPMDSEEVLRKVESIQLSVQRGRIVVQGEDITHHLHTPAVDKLVGKVAKELYVRNRVHEVQRQVVESMKEGIVMDGRDIGTVVLPDAFLKIFITAKDTTRAQRRTKQTEGDYESILAGIRKRDHQDMTREHGPLAQAEDAILVENDDITLEETVDKIVALFEERKKQSSRC